MRLLLCLAALAMVGCTPSRSGGGTFGSPPPMDFSGPLIPSVGGPATAVQRRVPDHPAASAPTTGARHASLPTATPVARPPAPATPLLDTRVRKVTVQGIQLTCLAFDDRRCSISVADKSAGPHSDWQTAAVAAASHDALAVINGGFFTPEGKPLGLVVENGERFGAWNGSSSLTSGVLVVTDARAGLVRRERWSPGREIRHLLQSGPLLLDSGDAVGGLEDDPRRPRSFIAWDGRHHWVIGFARSATLAGLAKVLATQPIPGVRLRTAVNLDGGSSSELWVAPGVPGGPVSTRQFWNKPVRNYVIVKQRTP